MTLHARLPASQVTVNRHPMSTRTLNSPTLRSCGDKKKLDREVEL
jgi:hypothetical protein